MSDKENSKEEKTPSEPIKGTYQPPKGQRKIWPLRLAGKNVDCAVVADWILIRKKEKPIADVFYTYYSSKTGKNPRPLAFVFNGGPGASSAYLHVGAMGPKITTFGDKGECP